MNRVEGGDGNDYLVGGGSGSSNYLYGMLGNDILDAGTGTGGSWLEDTSGNNLFYGRDNSDYLASGKGNDLFIGGTASDSIELDRDLAGADGRDIFLYNKGDGKDSLSIKPSTLSGADGTLSIGNAKYSEIGLSYANGIVSLSLGNGSPGIQYDHVNSNKNPVRYLQVIVDGMRLYDPASSDAMYSNKVAVFDFVALAEDYLQAKASKQRWNMLDGLRQNLLWTSDTVALGGELAYQYAKLGNIDGIANDNRLSIINDASYGLAGQAIDATAGVSNFTSLSSAVDGASFKMFGNTDSHASDNTLTNSDSAITVNAGDLHQENDAPGREETTNRRNGARLAGIPFALQRMSFNNETDHSLTGAFGSGSTFVSSTSSFNLRTIAQAMADFSPRGLSRRHEGIQIGTSVSSVAADPSAPLVAASPAIWSLTDALLDFHLSGSDMDAVGGDLASQHSMNGAAAGLDLSAAQNSLSSSQFEQSLPTLKVPSAWQSEIVRLG